MRVAEFHVPLSQAGSALTPLLVLAGITIFAVALLAFGSMRRMIAMIAIASVGEIVFAVALGMQAGPRSGLAGMPAHALGLALVSSAGALWERQGAGGQGSHRLARPMLVLGLLTLIGVPPFAGWPAKALLFDAAARHGMEALVAVVGGHLLLVVAAVRLGQKMLDPSPPPGAAIVSPPSTGEEASFPPVMIRITAATLMLLSIALGVYPRPLLERAERAARAFPIPAGTADQP